MLQKKIDCFLGIPFAQPPTGNLRFRPPQPLKHSSHEYDATGLPPSCYQAVGEAVDPKIAELWDPNTKLSEDCLYLNIWKPKGASNSNKAVMVSLHSHACNICKQEQPRVVSYPETAVSNFWSPGRVPGSPQRVPSTSSGRPDAEGGRCSKPVAAAVAAAAVCRQCGSF